MSTYKQLIICLLTCIITNGCHPDTEGPDATLTVTPTELTFLASDASEQTIQLQSSATWSLLIHEKDSWITTDKQQGEAGTHTITIRSSENPSYGLRTGSLQIRCGSKTNQQVTIYQQGQPVPEDQPELKALAAWYNATDGPNWHNNTNWLSTKPFREWAGIRCDSEGHVIRIYLPDCGLNGFIPPEIGLLTHLQDLGIHQNKLHGKLPPEMGKLSQLEIFTLYQTSVDGPIPPEFTQLTRLRQLLLNDNKLSHSLPTDFGNMRALEQVTLHKNQLSGELPSSIGHLTQLKSINLSFNHLTGSLPAGICDIPTLESLNISNNQLSGSLPPSLGAGSRLTQLDLSLNTLSGPIPASLIHHPNWSIFRLLPQQSGHFSNEELDPDSDNYTQDGAVSQYMTHTQGGGVKLIFMGDGFTSHDMTPGGLYETTLHTLIDALFQHEPMHTFRNYFDVYLVKAISAQSGISDPIRTRNSCFSTYHLDFTSARINANREKVLKYAAKTPAANALSKVSICVIAKSPQHGGTTYFSSSSANIAISTTFFGAEGTMIHEFAGHALGLLADEYTGNESLSAGEKNALLSSQRNGYYLNVEVTDDPSSVRWRYFFGRSGYEMVGAYEGGHHVRKGVYRPERSSRMTASSNPYFNAPSRELIVKRLLQLAGLPYTFDLFLAKDVRPPATRSLGIMQRKTNEEMEESVLPVFVD